MRCRHPREVLHSNSKPVGWKIFDNLYRCNRVHAGELCWTMWGSYPEALSCPCQQSERIDAADASMAAVAEQIAAGVEPEDIHDPPVDDGLPFGPTVPVGSEADWLVGLTLDRVYHWHGVVSTLSSLLWSMANDLRSPRVRIAEEQCRAAARELSARIDVLEAL